MNKETKKWQLWLPYIVTAIMALWIIGNIREDKETTAYNVEAFSRIPVLLEGRIQPIDSVARNALLMLRGKASVLVTDRPQEELGFFEKAKLKKLTPAEWFLEATTRPDEADKHHIFRIDNQEVLGLIKLPIERKFFSFNELKDGWGEIEKQANQIREAKLDPAVQTPFQKQIVKTQFALGLYFRIKNSLRPENVESFAEEVKSFEDSLKPGLAALRAQQANQQFVEEDLRAVASFFKRYEMLSRAAYPLIIPPSDPKNVQGWTTIGGSLMEALRTGSIHPAVQLYARMADAFGKQNPAEFNSALAEFKGTLASTGFTRELMKGRSETFFNHYAPFIKSIAVYLLAFILGCSYWLNWSQWTRRTAFQLINLALIVHTSGLIFRMYLEGRPPVTNLYSSAIFVGWGAVVLGLILERVWKDGIGVVTASAVGIVTLIIAHNLALGGDTMKMLQAVLDTNFWLATHVVVITLGYSAMFVAGLLAMVYILRGVLTRTLTSDTGRALTRMVYGIICFATLFSFVGTVLGGIWADQSWGRFWGWDPKENGALMIVIWCAVVLHARWGGLIRERGMMVCALIGNIITAFSWFGVNMLGVGLHSYGFMDGAWRWMAIFYASQLAVMGLAFVPVKSWRSNQLPSENRKPSDPPLGAKPAAA